MEHHKMKRRIDKVILDEGTDRECVIHGSNLEMLGEMDPQDTAITVRLLAEHSLRFEYGDTFISERSAERDAEATQVHEEVARRVREARKEWEAEKQAEDRAEWEARKAAAEEARR